MFMQPPPTLRENPLEGTFLLPVTFPGPLPLYLQHGNCERRSARSDQGTHLDPKRQRISRPSKKIGSRGKLLRFHAKMLGCPLRGPQTCNTHFTETLTDLGGICVSRPDLQPLPVCRTGNKPTGISGRPQIQERGDFIKRGARK